MAGREAAPAALRRERHPALLNTVAVETTDGADALVFDVDPREHRTRSSSAGCRSMWPQWPDHDEAKVRSVWVTSLICSSATWHDRVCSAGLHELAIDEVIPLG